jgi:hypothetical protein
MVIAAIAAHRVGLLHSLKAHDVAGRRKEAAVVLAGDKHQPKFAWGDIWIEDPVAYRKAVDAVIGVLNAFKPAGNDQDDPHPEVTGDGAVVLSPADFVLVRSLFGDAVKRRFKSLPF